MRQGEKPGLGKVPEPLRTIRAHTSATAKEQLPEFPRSPTSSKCNPHALLLRAGGAGRHFSDPLRTRGPSTRRTKRSLSPLLCRKGPPPRSWAPPGTFQSPLHIHVTLPGPIGAPRASEGQTPPAPSVRAGVTWAAFLPQLPVSQTLPRPPPRRPENGVWKLLGPQPGNESPGKGGDTVRPQFFLSSVQQPFGPGLSPAHTRGLPGGPDGSDGPRRPCFRTSRFPRGPCVGAEFGGAAARGAGGRPG